MAQHPISQSMVKMSLIYFIKNFYEKIEPGNKNKNNKRQIYRIITAKIHFDRAG
jgi:hypothetical protein